MKPANTASHPYTESKLKEFGLDWELGDVAISDIDDKESTANHARLIGTDQNVVDEYAVAMSRGDVFPRIVCRKHGSKYITFGGNHTYLGAKKAGHTHVAAYIVSTSSREDDDLVPRVLNRGHGLRQDKSEALANAMYAIQKYEKTPKQAAEMFGLPSDAVNEELRRRKVKELLEKSRVQTSSIPNTALLKLNPINLDSVKIAAGRLIASSKMKGQDVDVFLDALKKESRTEATQMAVIAEYEQKMEVGPQSRLELNGHRNTSKKKQFAACITTFERLTDKINRLAQLGFDSDEETKRTAKRLQTISKKAHCLSRS